MGRRYSTISIAMAACAASWLAATTGGLQAQQAPAAMPGMEMASAPGLHADGGDGSSLPYGLFAAVDVNKDGGITRAELKGTLEKWLSDADTAKTGTVTEADLATAVKLQQPQLPMDSHLKAMLAALPDQPAAKPRQARKVLVLNRTAGFIHTPIPLVGKMIDAFGNKTKAWSTTITYDPADINARNLEQYHALVLNSTTGAFLDDPNDPSATGARKKALIDFVRGGKGLVGIHGTGDSYHATSAPPAAAASGQPAGAARGGRGGGGARRGAGATLATQIVAQGDKNNDQKVSKDEVDALADGWFDTLDREKVATVRQDAFAERVTAIVTPPNPAPPAEAAAGGGRAARGGGEGGRAGTPGRDAQMGTWPDYNKMIGGFFKFHFGDQAITLKLDDPKSPLTAMFKGQPPAFRGEVYTFGMETWSRDNLHVLTSLDYSKMTEADRAKENFPRSDHDYGLTWIRRDGNGRVFYFAFGNEERTFFIKAYNEQLLAGLQYALGDLKADDSPSAKPGTRSGTR